MRRPLVPVILVACFAGAILVSAAPQAPRYFALAEVRPGQIAIGRTVFSGGNNIEEFRAHILGVITNVAGPKRSLILARLEGGPLAQTGVIQGMSGSPMYIDGRLVGALSYSLGSFPKEPLAGITPIAEMEEALANGTAPAGSADLALTWPASKAEVFAALSRVAARTLSPAGDFPAQSLLQGSASNVALAPSLRPIGLALSLNGFDPTVDSEMRRALGAGERPALAPQANSAAKNETPLRPGDPVGVGMVRGDYELGATGTVTHVDGTRVFAFGHPFLNLGTTTLAMTRAHVYTVVPSLDASMKIAVLGPVVGTVTQDRTTGIGGTLGPPPRELAVRVRVTSPRAPDRELAFQVLHDQALTPLLTYVAILNAVAAYERQTGSLTATVTGRVSFGNAQTVEVDDVFAGEGVMAAVASAMTTPVGAAAGNEFRSIFAESIDVTVRVTEQIETTTVERVWIDTTRPRTGETCNVHVLLRNYRGGTETITLPVVMPAQPGPVTLLVADAPTLSTLEDRELQPGKPNSWAELLTRLGSARRNNRLYVRLIRQQTGTVVGGSPLPALPASVRSVLDDDNTVATSPVARSVLFGSEHRLQRVVRGSRELKLTVTAGSGR